MVLIHGTLNDLRGQVTGGPTDLCKNSWTGKLLQQVGRVYALQVANLASNPNNQMVSPNLLGMILDVVLKE